MYRIKPTTPLPRLRAAGTPRANRRAVFPLAAQMAETAPRSSISSTTTVAALRSPACRSFSSHSRQRLDSFARLKPASSSPLLEQTTTPSSSRSVSSAAQSTMATTNSSTRIERPVLFVCDIQEKFRPAIHEFDKVVLTTQKLIRFAKALSVPIHTTTQNAARLGPTVAELDSPHPHIDKTAFSMLRVPAVAALLAPKSSVALAGIESHVCIAQTALDLLAAGHAVYVVADAVSSCNREEVPLALERLRAEGAVVLSSEAWMYEVMGDAAIPEFKEVIKIVKESSGATRAALGALAPRI